MTKQKPQPEILDFAQLQIRRHDATVAMLAALKVAVAALAPSHPLMADSATAKQLHDAIAQAEAAGFKVP